MLRNPAAGGIALFFSFLPISLLAATELRVISESGEPVEFGTAIIEEIKFKTNFTQGKLILPELKQGEYTLRLTAPGHRSVAEKIRVPLRKNALTLPVEVRRTQTVRLITYEEKHSVSRHQLEQHEIKSVPATFGDNLSALATLPGVNRPGGIFGPLVIRGAPDTANRYFLDDIPIINPQHFGGFQSVIANELIDELTLISSAFPAFYGQALAAVIDIRTLEAVPKARSTVEAGIISTNAFFAAPWAFFAPKPMPLPGNATEEERRTHAELQKQSQLDTGFFSISGRVGYLSLLVPPLYKIFTGRELIAVPEYYDYQWKSRWYPGATQRHALTFFVFGSYDTFTLVRRLSEEEKRERVEQGENPAAGDLTVFNDISSHTQSLSYDFRPERNIKLRTLFFNALIFSRFYRDAPANALGAINVVTRPNIAGVREIFDIHYLDRRGRLRGGIDYQFFYFNTSGVTQQRKETIPSGMTNFNDPNHFDVIDVTVSGQNHLISAYADNRLEFGGFFLSPGVRSDHLSRSGETTFNVRGLGGYKFRSGTTFAFSGGTYSSFAQTNFHRFNQATRREVRVVEAGYLRSEKAIHRSVALEQEWGFHILRAEAFYNNLYDLMQATPAAAQAQGIFYANTGAALTRGIELSYRKSLYENEDGFFGWVSYTYTRADVSGVAGSFPFRFEQRHVVKLIGVLRIAGWELGARFELFTGFPYTPIVASYCAPGYLCDGNPATTFYVPVYSNAINSANYPLFHRLDLRLTRKNNYSWGSFSWFIEFINVYNNEPLIRQVFRNSEPYQPGRNPTLRGPTIPLNLIPNFGLEWKF